MTVLDAYLAKAREVLPRCESYEQEEYLVSMLIEAPYFYKGKFNGTGREMVNFTFQKSRIKIEGGVDILTFWRYIPERRLAYLEEFLNKVI